MAQTQEGAYKARDTNQKKYGPKFYQEIGKLGGAASNTGGFAYDGRNKLDKLLNRPKQGTLLARKAGSLGGQRSRRGPADA